MTAPLLVLFARYPVAGECKTRLIPAVGEQGAANIHRILAERTTALLLDSQCRVTVATTGASHNDFANWLGDRPMLVEQGQGDLTDRLLPFAAQAPVILFGADTPDLARHHVEAAIAGLRDHDVVIGPAEDGGYYLIGLAHPMPQLFTAMPWSTDQVLPETLRRLDQDGIAPLLLETLSDCDRPEDLARWPQLAELAQA